MTDKGAAGADNNITTGKVYKAVIERERKVLLCVCLCSLGRHLAPPAFVGRGAAWSICVVG